eukprot:TRINITY_DN36376_c0_g1_i1.p1 TRINITY_DN36376_c0_g1~~TRINITY_DN36376_c0_g1_i1.p1  ORF type:complete len:2690 (+),score=1136.41 TRINITY_DN36376_c0_g1_i1:51-8072(+)
MQAGMEDPYRTYESMPMPAAGPRVGDKGPPAAPRRWLMFGDVVTLYNDDDARGWLSAVPGDSNLRVDSLDSGVLVPPNLRDCRFMITAPRRYVASKKLRKDLELTGREATLFDSKARCRSESERLLREQVQEERDRNEEDERIAEGHPVVFGATVQLRHLATGQFVTRRKAMARVERECLKAELCDYGDDGSHWRVQPVYKYREVGQKVPFGDAVTFQTQGSGGFLRVGGFDQEPSVVLHPSYVENVLEANVGQSPSRWLLLPYRTVNSHRDPAIRGGDVIFMSHQETASLLCWDHDQGRSGVRFGSSGQDVAHAAAADKGIPAHTHAIWKVEAQHVQWAGLRVEPARHYRLLNVGSSLYLSLNDDGEATLSNEYMEQSCLWEFAPIDEDDGAGSDDETDIRNVFLRHSGTGTWLHYRNTQAVSSAHKELNQHLALVRLSRSDCHEVDWARVRRWQLLELVDAWKGGRGDDPEVLEMKAAEGVDVVRQILWFLSSSDEGHEGPPSSPPAAWDPLLETGQATHASQRLLRELGVIDATLQLLQIIVPWVAENRESDPKQLHTLATFAHWMLRAACAGSSESKLQLSSQVSSIIQHMSMVAPRSVKAVELLSELLMDNRSMIRDLKAEDISEFTGVYMRYRRPQDLQLLASLCVCQGAPMPFIQNRIVAEVVSQAGCLPTIEWQQSSDGSRSLRVRAQDADGDEKVAVIVEPPGASRSTKGRFRGAATAIWLGKGARIAESALVSPTSKLAAVQKAAAAAIAPPPLQVVAERALDLLAACTLGRLETAKAAATAASGWRSRQGLSELARNSQVPKSLRRGALRLLLNLYVDQEPLAKVPSVRYTRLWSKVDDTAGPRGGKVPHAVCADVLDTVYECLRDGLRAVQDTSVASPPAGVNVASADRRAAVGLVEVCTWALGVLVDLGALNLSTEDAGARRDVTRFCDILVDSLDAAGFDRVGSDVCGALARLFDLRVDVRISRLFQSYDRLYAERDGEIIPVPQADLSSLRSDLFESVIISEKVTATRAEAFSQTLMKVISADGVSVSLRRRAFRLLFRHTAQPAHFIREIKKVTVLALAEAAEVHVKAASAAKTLGRLMERIAMDTAEPATPDGPRVVPEQCAEANRTAQLVLAELCSLLRRDDETGSDVPPSGAAPRLGTCDLRGVVVEGHSAEVVKKYQDVLRNAGVHRSVIDILYLPLKRTHRAGLPDLAQNQEQLVTFTECYAFLRLFCRDNKDNQEMVFRHFPHFLRHVGVKGLNTADAVAEAIRDNPGLSAQVDDKLLRTFIQAIVKYGKRARWLRLMEAFVEANGRPVQRNQDRVLTMVLAEEGETVLELDGNQGGEGACAREGEKTRYELMLEREHETAGMQSFVRYHVTCVRLLSKCSVSNRSNAQKCSAHLSLSKVLENILSLDKVGGEPKAEKCTRLHPSTVRFVKAPFVAYLHHVHMDSKQSESFTEGSVQRAMWGPSGVLAGLCDDLRAYGDSLLQPPPEDPLELQRADQLSGYVTGTVLPLLTKFYQSSRKDGCFVTSGGDDRANQAVVLRLASSCTEAACVVADRVSSVAALKVVRDLLAQLTAKYAPPADSDVQASGGEEHAALSGSGLSQETEKAALDDDCLERLLDAVERVDSALEEQEAAKRDTRSAEEVDADRFKSSWALFWKAFAGELGVNPSQTVGNGLRRLVSLLAPRTDVLEQIADMMRWQGEVEVAGEEPDRALRLSGLRVLRAWLHFGEEATSASKDEWEEFIRGVPPVKCTQALADRQRASTDLGFIPAITELVGSAEAAVSKEALLLMVVLTHGHHSITGSDVQAAMLEHLSVPLWQAGSKPFLTACRDLIKQSIQSLKERKKLLKRKKAEREAKKQAKRMRDNRSRTSAGSPRDGASDTGSCGASDSGRSDGSLASTALLGGTQVADEEEAGESTPWADTGNIIEVLVILANLCKGGHSKLQHLLATSVGGTRETLLDELALYLTQVEPQLSVSSSGNKQPLRVMERIYLAIREMIRGNHGGFNAFLDTKTLDATCRIMGHLKYDGNHNDLKGAVRRSILLLLRTIIEGITTADADLAVRLCTKVDSQVLLAAWKELCGTRLVRRQSVSGLPYGDESALSDESSQAFIVLHGLSEVNKGIWQTMRREEGAFEMCHQKMRVIEIQSGGALARLRFTVSPVAEEIAAGARFRQSVQALQTRAVAADDDEEKHQLFQDGMLELVRNEIQERKLKDKPGFGRLHERRDQVRYLPLVITMLLNSLLLLCEPIIFLEANGNETAADGDGGAGWANTFGWTALILCSLMHTSASLLRLVHCVAVHWTFSEDSDKDPKERIRSLIHGRVGVELAYTLFSLAGLLISPYFFTLHMFELMDTPPVRLLLDCVLGNYIKLAQAGAVIVLVVYIYSVLGFKFFPERHEEGKCQTLLNCFVSYLDGGLTGGGIHGVLTGFTAPASLWDVDFLPWLLTMMQMSYFTVYVVVLLGVFSGIIIDSFGQLRDETSEVNERLRTRCFISGLEKSVIEQAGGEPLPLWSYVDFFLHLETTDEEVLSDLEAHVACMIRDGNSSWMPLRKCFAVTAGGQDEAEKQTNAVQDAMDRRIQVLERLILQQNQLLGGRLAAIEKQLALLSGGGGQARKMSLSTLTQPRRNPTATRTLHSPGVLEVEPMGSPRAGDEESLLRSRLLDIRSKLSL